MGLMNGWLNTKDGVYIGGLCSNSENNRFDCEFRRDNTLLSNDIIILRGAMVQQMRGLDHCVCFVSDDGAHLYFEVRVLLD
jgi:hypothetical protein